MKNTQFNLADAKSKREDARISMTKRMFVYRRLGLEEPWREGTELASEAFDMEHDFMWEYMGVRCSRDERFNDDDWRMAFLAGFTSKAKYLKAMKRHVELRAKYNFHVTGNI